MKLARQSLAFVLFALPAFSCAAAGWHWAIAQCSDEADEQVYMIAALAEVATDGQQGIDDARFGFGNYAEANYAEEHCGVASITAQNMDASGEFDSRDEAAVSLDAYLGEKEAQGHAWLSIVRVDDYIDE